MAFLDEPSNIEEFKDYIFRRLGAPVIRINVEEQQAYDRIHDALHRFHNYHHAGSNKTFIDMVLTAEDIANKYITLPDNIVDVGRVLPSIHGYGRALFSPIQYAQYTMMYNLVFGAAPAQIHGYTIAMSHLELIDEQLGHKLAITFNRYDDKLHLITDWNQYSAGDHIVVECFTKQDGVQIYGDPWLKAYATALVKYQWGENLSKFKGVQLLNGISYDGPGIKAEAQTEINKLEDTLRNGLMILPLPVIM